MTLAEEAKRTGRHVDLALAGIVLTVLLQGASAIWWASKMDKRVETLEQRFAPVASMVETTARLDERTSAMAKSVERVERKIDAWEERRR